MEASADSFEERGEAKAPELHQLEQFLYHEAMLLDRERYEEWLELFTDDGLYWVPASPDQDDPRDHVSLCFEDRTLRSMRVRRLRHPQAFSLESPVRASRLVGNVVLESFDPASRRCRVRSAFQLVQLQYGEKHLYAGFYLHDLVIVEGALRIRMKRVDLLDCDQPQETLQAFL